MKDFIEYKEALALKELGFEEDCLMHVDYTGNLYMCNGDYAEYEVKNGKYKKIKYKFKTPEKYSTVNIPTFSQVFRFFREKYNLECVIDINTKFINNFQPVEKLYKIQIIKSDEYSTERHNKLLDTKLNIPTFEEAELECLKKLISVVS